VLQALGRGFCARQLRKRKSRGIVRIQQMGRGYLARVYRDKLRQEREAMLKRKQKEDRERKIRERKEAMERQEAAAKSEQEAADAARKQKMKLAAARATGGSSMVSVAEGIETKSPGEAKSMKFSRKLGGDDADARRTLVRRSSQAAQGSARGHCS
jgi:phosphoglycerate-specific signal transduction histidine kinase